MGILRKSPQAQQPTPEHGPPGHFKRLDGTFISLTPEELDANPALQREILVASVMDDVDEALARLGTIAPPRSDVLSSVDRLTAVVFGTNDQQLMLLLVRLGAQCTGLVDMELDALGEAMLGNVSMVSHYRAVFEAREQPQLERDLSLLATTALKSLEVRPDYVDVIRAIQEAAGRHLGK